MIAGEAPLYGTIKSLLPVVWENSSPAKWEALLGVGAA